MADEDLAALSAATGIDLEAESQVVPSTETPQATEGTDTPEPQAGDAAKPDPTAKPVTPAPVAKEPQPQHMVPLETMIAERREFQKQMNELRALVGKKPEPEAKPVELPDPFIDPKGFAEAIANQRSQEAIKQAMESTVNPVQQQLRSAVDYLHRTAAESKFSADEVQQAEAELTKLQQETGQLTPPELVPYLITPQRPNPYVNAVMWLRERQLRQEVGGDVGAYKQRLLDQALQDPEYLGRATEAARLYAAGQPVGQAQPQSITASPRPSAKPLPSVNRAGSGANAAPQQRVPTDEDFMSEALKGRR
jgi:hypothetical protein